MSIASPASSRWSRGWKPSSGTAPTSRTSLVLGAGGGSRVGQVGQRRERLLQLLFDLGQLELELLGARGHAAHGRDLALALTRVGSSADAHVRLVLLGAQPLQLRKQLAPATIELDHPIKSASRRVPAPSKRRPNAIGVLADELQVEHASSLPVRPSQLPTVYQYRATKPKRWVDGGPTAHAKRRGRDDVNPPALLRRQRDVGRRHLFGFEPGVLGEERATSCASSPTTMFSGMIAPEKPPLRIA